MWFFLAMPLIVTKWSYGMNDAPAEITVLSLEEPVVVGGGEARTVPTGHLLSSANELVADSGKGSRRLAPARWQ